MGSTVQNTTLHLRRMRTAMQAAVAQRQPPPAVRGAAESEIETELSPVLWGRLPVELLREILFILAKSSTEKARELRLVSTAVNVLVLPILFRNIVMLKSEHVHRVATTLVPTKRTYFTTFKSRLRIVPRMLASYKVDSWVLVVPDRRPSIETALEGIAPIFHGITKLVITGQNLGCNAFWLRNHPIHPTTVFLVHYGSPHLVNFFDPVFKAVTHLYTSITTGHRFSRISDLPALTHLALNTRANLPPQTAINVVATINGILKSCPNLVRLVFLIDFKYLEDPLYRIWEAWLEIPMQDKRFVFLPDYRTPLQEWTAIINDRKDLWGRAHDWKTSELAEERLRQSLRQQFMKISRDESATLPLFNPREDVWEIDLVQRDDYQPQPEDPDLRPHVYAAAFG